MKKIRTLLAIFATILLSASATNILVAFADDDSPPGLNFDFGDEEEDTDAPPSLNLGGEDEDSDLPPNLNLNDDDEDEPADDDDDDDDGNTTPPPPPPGGSTTPPPPPPGGQSTTPPDTDLSETGPEAYVFLLLGLLLSLGVNRKLVKERD